MTFLRDTSGIEEYRRSESRGNEELAVTYSFGYDKDRQHTGYGSGFQAGYSLCRPSEQAYKVPTIASTSNFNQASHLRASGSLDDNSRRSSLVLQQGFGNADESAGPPDRFPQLLDAQVPDMTPFNSQRGSPCRQAAAEFMDMEYEDGGDALEIAPSLSHSQADLFPEQPGRSEQSGMPMSTSYSSEVVEREASASPSPPPIPGLGNQPDWFTAMMEQAQSVGLWGGPPAADKKPQRQSSPLTGIEERAQPSTGSLAMYKASMASMLSVSQSHKQSVSAQLSTSGMGVIMRDSPQLRLKPVSLSMPTTYIKASTAASRQPGMNDGPFRPPTKPRPGTEAGDADLRTPMLHQSKMQLSLGLGADHRIDLSGWGYGEGSAGAGEPSMGSDAVEDMRAVPDTSQMPGAQQLKAVPVTGPPGLAFRPIQPAFTNATDADLLTATLTNGHLSAPAACPLPSLSNSAMSASLGSPRNGETVDVEAGLHNRALNRSTQSIGEVPTARAECLERYREKKRRRLFSKFIRYHKRKVNADKRPRMKGRFVKASEAEEAVAVEADEGEGVLSDCGIHRQHDPLSVLEPPV